MLGREESKMTAANQRARRSGNPQARTRRALGAALVGLALGCQPPPPRSLAPTEPSSRAPTAPVHFSGRSGSGVSSSESAQDDRLGSIRARLEALASNIMIFWKAHGL